METDGGPGSTVLTSPVPSVVTGPAPPADEDTEVDSGAGRPAPSLRIVRAANTAHDAPAPPSSILVAKLPSQVLQPHPAPILDARTDFSGRTGSRYRRHRGS